MNQQGERKRRGRDVAETIAPILVVDDDAEMRGIIGERLAIEGFEVAFASSGEEALLLYLSAVQAGRPWGALLLDVRMGILGGLEVLRLIRGFDEESPILVISGFGDLAAAVHSLREGADDYISKPIKIWDLRDRVTTAAARRRALTRRSGEASERGLGWGMSLKPSRAQTETEEPQREQRGPAAGAHSETSSETSRKPAREDEGIGSKHRESSGSGLGRETGASKRGAEGSDLGESRSRLPPRRGDERRPPGREESSADRSGESIASGGEGGVSSAAGPNPRPGGSERSAPASLLDALFQMTAGVEAGQASFAGHGDRVAQWVTKLGARIARGLGIEPTELDALRVAARLHALGLVRRRGASLLVHSLAEARAHDSPLAPDQDVEGPRAAQALLQARAQVAEEIASAGASWGIQDAALDTAAIILGEVGRRRAELVATGKASTDPRQALEPRTARLVELFEIADAWVHRSGPVIGVEGARAALAKVTAQFEASGGPERPQLIDALRQLAGLGGSADAGDA